MIREPDEKNGGKGRVPDARAVLRSLERHWSATESSTRDNAYQAQQLVFDAWEAASEDEEAKLMEKALQLNARNVDALLYTVGQASLDLENEIKALRNIIKAGEEDLGAKLFNESAGNFWGLIETRPYMRARQRLIQSLYIAGRIEEAIEEAEAKSKRQPGCALHAAAALFDAGPA